MITFKTKSGSVYEVETVWDYGNMGALRRLRRLNGKHRPTQRQGEDGEWGTYLAMFPEMPEVGKSVMIHWKNNPNGSMNCTVTSAVVEVTLA